MLIQTALNSRRLHIILWCVQVLLALFYGVVGCLKVSRPIPELAEVMVWPGLLPEPFVRFVGRCELAGALGLILPMLTNIHSRLTILSAFSLVALQVCAMGWHTLQGEWLALPINCILLLLAAFVFWGRRIKLPL